MKKTQRNAKTHKHTQKKYANAHNYPHKHTNISENIKDTINNLYTGKKNKKTIIHTQAKKSQTYRVSFSQAHKLKQHTQIHI